MNRIMLVFIITATLTSSAFAGEIKISNARVTQVLAHGSYFDTDTFVVVFNKTVGDCDKTWVNTKTKQAERIFEMVMTAYLHNKPVDYAMDPDSRRSGSRGSTCEMRYLWLK